MTSTSNLPMASSIITLLLALAMWVSPSTAQTPKTLVVPVSKDYATRQYVIRLRQRTPLVPVRLTVHLGGRHLWVPCDNDYVSSTKRILPCSSPRCTAGKPLGCSGSACVFGLDNPFDPSSDPYNTTIIGDVAEDVLSVASADGSKSGPAATVRDFVFACGLSSVFNNLAEGVAGVAGLGRSQVSLPSQLTGAFSLPRKFAVCLTQALDPGVIFFGDGPYKFVLPDRVVPDSVLAYTPLLTNPAGTFNPTLTSEYFVGVKSIKVNNRLVPIDAALLSFNRNGVGGTKISTAVPYTVLHTAIYNAVANAFARESRLRRVAPVAPFGHCFSNVPRTKGGRLAVPEIDLVLQSDSVVWRILGDNSMVAAKPGALCLGFVDGGAKPRTSIVIGGYQLEDNLLQFDLGAARLGFTSLAHSLGIGCAHFNFTSYA